MGIKYDIDEWIFLTLIKLCEIFGWVENFSKIKWVYVMWDCWLIREIMFKFDENQYNLVRIEPMIDKLHFNLFSLWVVNLLCCYISRTCFRPIQDYIDVHDYMNMIETIGWATISK